MSTKICKKCQQEKNVDEFPKRQICRSCYNEQRKVKNLSQQQIDKQRAMNNKSYNSHKQQRIKQAFEYNQSHKQEHQLQQKKTRKKQQESWKEWKDTLKCEQCGENHPQCLEFHHVDPSQKDFMISKIRFSSQKLKKELEKCIVLCSNCHRKLHY